MPHPLDGKQLGNYVVRGLLGEGAMGAVFLGEHRFLGDRVAIKLLHGTYAGNKSLAARFFTEARATRTVEHPNVVRIVDFGQSDDGALYLVMELLEGESLAERLRRGRLDEKQAAEVAMGVALALAAAHGRGIIHRDLKPANVFLRGGVPSVAATKVVDFGIAKVMDGEARTDSDALLGTPKYMAPEQARGARHVSSATDVYALGVMLFEMLTGKLPYGGASVQELLTAVLFATPPEPRTLAPVSDEMNALVLACLAKEPSERPSMLDVARRLATLGGGDSNLVDTLSESVGQSVSRRSMMSRRGGLGLVGGALVLAAGATGLWFATHAGARRPMPVPVAAAPGLVVAPVTTAKVVVRSVPPGATVEIDGKPAGTTPALVEVTPPREVRVRMKGYLAAHEVVTGPGEITLTLAPEPPPKKPVAPARKPRRNEGEPVTLD